LQLKAIRGATLRFLLHRTFAPPLPYSSKFAVVCDSFCATTLPARSPAIPFPGKTLFKVKAELELEGRVRALSDWFQCLSQTHSLLRNPAAVSFFNVPSGMLPDRPDKGPIAKAVPQCPPSKIFAAKPQVHSISTAALSNGAKVNGFTQVRGSATCFMGIP
jgi:hypothetical protein